MKFLRGLLSFLIGLAFLALVAGGAAFVWFNNELTKPGPLADEVVFVVQQGETLTSVADRLVADGILADDRVLRFKARIDNTENKIKSGEFIIEPQASVATVLGILIEGRSVVYKITIPEGRTTAQVLRMIEADENLVGDLPEVAPPEGSLLPDTYQFHKGMTRIALLAKMQTAQAALLDELWPKRQDNLPINTREEAVILASVVEKETGRPDERDEVAGLFIGRLRNNMRLQSDPTIIYGITKGEPLFHKDGRRRTLFRSEIDRKTDWNTYQIHGLPKTPICNPGREAIAAVLNPPETDYVFFVAECKDGNITGDHVFSKTLADHNRAVAAYRKCADAEIARERANR